MRKKLLSITQMSSSLGGLATVIYLDTLMAFVMVGGASIMTYIGKGFYWFQNEMQFTKAVH